MGVFCCRPLVHTHVRAGLLIVRTQRITCSPSAPCALAHLRTPSRALMRTHTRSYTLSHSHTCTHIRLPSRSCTQTQAGTYAHAHIYAPTSVCARTRALAYMRGSPSLRAGGPTHIHAGSCPAARIRTRGHLSAPVPAGGAHTYIRTHAQSREQPVPSSSPRTNRVKLQIFRGRPGRGECRRLSAHKVSCRPNLVRSHKTS